MFLKFEFLVFGFYLEFVFCLLEFSHFVIPLGISFMTLFTFRKKPQFFFTRNKKIITFVNKLNFNHMKKLYFLLFIAFSFATNAQIVNIPDANFKAMLLSASANNTVASTETASY